MKNIIFLIFFSNSILSFGQMEIFVILKPNVNLIFENNSFPYGAITTSDTGLNQILTNNNSQFAEIGGSSSCLDIGGGSNTFGNENLINELNNYSTGVEIAYPIKMSENYLTNFYIDLVEPNQGVYINSTNNIVQTNNTALNAVFNTYGVFSYKQNKIFTCLDCNIDNVLASLSNLPNVVSNYQFCSEIFLSNNDFNTTNSLKISVKNKTLNIQSENNDLKTVSVYNLIGKELISTITNQPINIDQLSTGIYIVKVTVNNISKTFKIAI